MKKIDAIILAGGFGTRLKSVVSDVPKVLAPIHGKPFLDLLLRLLDQSGCMKKVVLAVGYMAEKIRAHYKDQTQFGFEIDFSEETQPLGTGGAIGKALASTSSDLVLALNGDSYVGFDLKELIQTHRQNHAAMTIVIQKVENASRYGSITIDEQKRILSFEEKKEGEVEGFINAGVYLFSPALFSSVNGDKMVSLEKDLLPDFLKAKGLFGFQSDGKFIDIGIPETYRMSEQFFKGV